MIKEKAVISGIGNAAGWGDTSYHLEHAMHGYGMMVYSWRASKPLVKNYGIDKDFLEIAKDKAETENFFSDYKCIYVRK